MDEVGTVWTVGHSTRTAEEFTGLLLRNGVQWVVDIRSFPGSRRMPHFQREVMRSWLKDADIAYLHVPALGGRRSRGLGDASPNGAWRNPSFRHFADHMQSPEFEGALDAVLYLADNQRVAMMCSEAVPWRCHRQLVGDAAVARGWRVLHIVSLAEPKAHTLTPFAAVAREHVTYPDMLAGLAAGAERSEV